MSYVYLATEDELSETVAKKLVQETFGGELEPTAIRKGGYGYLKSRLQDLGELARSNVVLLITDLDNIECAPELIRQWFGGNEARRWPLFRVAKRETEAWLMSDKGNFARYFDIPEARIARNAEDLPDPKRELIKLASRARRDIRAAIVPEKGVKAIQGLRYNEAFGSFCRTVLGY